MEGRIYYLAPLAGYTDVPYRLACRKMGCKYAYPALIDSGALVHGNPDNDAILQRDASEQWLGVQLLGSIPEDIAKSTEMLDAMDYDEINYNLGCPMQKVIKRPAGAGLLKDCNQEIAFTCIKEMRKRVHGKPFTVKLRILDFEDAEPTVLFCLKLQELGVEGIAIHGRLAESIYSGPVATGVIRAVREALHIPVTANGGIYGIEDADALHEATGCDRLMVARGSLGNPWIFRELEAGGKCPPTHEELCDTMEEHIMGMVPIYGEKKAFLLARKIIVAYIRGRGYSKEFRVRSTFVSGVEEFQKFVLDLRLAGPVCSTVNLSNAETL